MISFESVFCFHFTKYQAQGTLNLTHSYLKEVFMSLAINPTQRYAGQPPSEANLKNTMQLALSLQDAVQRCDLSQARVYTSELFRIGRTRIAEVVLTNRQSRHPLP